MQHHGFGGKQELPGLFTYQACVQVTGIVSIIARIASPHSQKLFPQIHDIAEDREREFGVSQVTLRIEPAG